jgi:hypothetical protein
MVGTYVFLAAMVIALTAFLIWLISGLRKNSRGGRRRR